MANFAEYDFAAWQKRMGYDNTAAAEALDIRIATLCKLRRDGGGRPLYMWAAYGRECAAHAAAAKV